MAKWYVGLASLGLGISSVVIQVLKADANGIQAKRVVACEHGVRDGCPTSREGWQVVALVGSFALFVCQAGLRVRRECLDWVWRFDTTPSHPKVISKQFMQFSIVSFEFLDQRGRVDDRVSLIVKTNRQCDSGVSLLARITSTAPSFGRSTVCDIFAENMARRSHQ